MIEPEARRVDWEAICRALFNAGYKIEPHGGFRNVIRPVRPVVFRVLPNRAGEKARSRSEMLRAAPETGPQAHMPGVGS